MASMKMLMILLLVTFICRTSYGVSESRGYDHVGRLVQGPEAQLHKDLFKDDAKTMFPLSQGVVNVKFGINLDTITDFEAANEAIVLNAFISQNWINTDVTWNPEDYGNITRINVMPEKVWKPDIYAYANIEDGIKYNGLLDTFKTQIIIAHDGKHKWLAPVAFRFSCTMNVADFPFDRQICPLRFGSYTYDANSVKIHPEPVNLQKYSESSEWTFESMKEISDETLYPGSKRIFSDIEYTVIVRRKPLYFLLNVVLPNLLLSILTVVVFVVPTDAGERSGYVITIILAMVWFMVSAIETMPGSSNAIPFFQYFLATTLLMMSLLLICLCYSIACWHADAGINEPPQWMKDLILDKLCKFFNMETETPLPKWRISLNTIHNAIIVKHDEKEKENPKEKTKNQCKLKDKTTSETSFISKEEKVNDLVKLFGIDTIREANKRLDTFIEGLESADDDERKQSEWFLISTALDKLFLYFFTIFQCLTLFVCTVQIHRLSNVV